MDRDRHPEKNPSMIRFSPDIDGFSPLALADRGRFISILPEKARILHAGCGTGGDMAAFLAAGYRVAGFDPNNAMIMACRPKLPPRTSLRKMAAQQFADPPGSWDGIWAPDVLSLVPMERQEAVLRAFVRSLGTGGVLMARVPSGEGHGQKAVMTRYDEKIARGIMRKVSLAVPCFTSVKMNEGLPGKGSRTEMLAVRM